jgi:hypothetical protein
LNPNFVSITAVSARSSSWFGSKSVIAIASIVGRIALLCRSNRGNSGRRPKV